MTTLVKAQLCELKSGDSSDEVGGTQVDVQFNPTSLRVAISNRSAGGHQAGSQARQRPGAGEIQVSFDLVFDTADEGTTEEPVPVTRKTQMVEKFVRPRGSAPSEQTPPRVQFKWGTFLVQGVMESANTDLDLFSADGTPLRAKVAVSIRGQDPSYRYQASQAGPGAGAAAGNAAGRAGSPPGATQSPPGAPGTRGGRDATAKVAQAMPGESLQQLAARNGLDPSAWRALAKDIANPLALPPGIEVALPASLRTGGGGASGLQGAGSDPARVAAQLPLVGAGALPATPAAAAPAAPASGARPDAVRSGQAVAQRGGVAGAIAQVRQGAQQSALDATFTAFGLPPEPAAVPRAYGGGVPLRPLRGQAGERAPRTPDPTVPGWQALQPRASGGPHAPGRTRPVDPCHCDCGPPNRRPRGD
ncbi:hypothetical protein BWI17_06270 [Betaproteobacteria bacterium GR16-43]|nr:hypothetical protein BWI17_06270 [Betaproteobacteria bacterium GR16-43]